jgi:hypothetical protein
MKTGKFWLVGTIILIFLTVGIFCVVREKYDGYDYDSENPNALISGKQISGTVYSSYPENTPGLGWIL